MIAYYRSFLSVILVLLLCGCGTTVECIDPDDWGGDLKVSVNAAPSNPTPVVASKPYGDQYIDWTKGFQLSGKPIIMIIDNEVNQTYSQQAQTPCHSGSLYTSATSSWRFLLSNHVNTNSPYKCDPNNGSCPEMPLCYFKLKTPYPWCPSGLCNMTTGDLPDTNLPCVLYQGLGLYSQIVKYPTGQSPNAPLGKDLKCSACQNGAEDTSRCLSDSTNCLLHVGNNACSLQDSTSHFSGCTTPFISQGCPAGGAAFLPPSDCTNNPGSESCFIYFKILDRYYSDNYGQYNVRFKQGVIKQGSPGFVTTFVGMVQSILCDDAESEFYNLITEPSYRNYIRILLTLYIIFLGVGYLTGFLDLSSQELIVRVFKMAIVIQLVTADSSWSFFYNYFFKFFQQGIGEITGIIFGDAIVNTKITIPGIPAESSCAFQNLSGFATFDKVIKELLSYETSRKMMTLLAWKGGGYVGGAILLGIMYIMIALVLFVLLKSVMIYLMCYLTISLLIILAPLFIPFILFKLTRHWFDGWLKNLVSYFIQPIIILTFAFFLVQIFMYQLHYLFGYRACFKWWFTFIDDTPLNIRVFAWQPDFKSPAVKQCILTPNSLLAPTASGQAGIKNSCTEQQRASGQCAHQGTDTNHPNLQGAFGLAKWPGPHDCTINNNYYQNQAHGEYCTPYTCTQERYVDYPYLDPEIKSDQARITELQNNDLMSIKDLGIFVLIVWFMMQFNNVVPSIARKISGNPQSFANISGAGAALGGSIAKWGGIAAGQAINHGLYRPLTGRRRDLFKDMKLAKKRLEELQDGTIDKAGKMRKKVGDAIDAKLANAPLAVRALHSIGSNVLNPDKALKKGVGALSRNAPGAFAKAATLPLKPVTKLLSKAGIKKPQQALNWIEKKADGGIVRDAKTAKEFLHYHVVDKGKEKAQDVYKAMKEKVGSVKGAARAKIDDKTAPIKAEYNKAKDAVVQKVKAAPGIRQGVAAKDWASDKASKASAFIDKAKSAPGIKQAVAVKRFWFGGGPGKEDTGSSGLGTRTATPTTSDTKPSIGDSKPDIRKPGALTPSSGTVDSSTSRPKGSSSPLPDKKPSATYDPKAPRDGGESDE